MLTKYTTLISFFSLTFISCDPAIGVVISNKSSVDRNIRVIYPPNYSLPFNTKAGTKDSLVTYDYTISPRDYYNYPVTTPILSLDTVNRTYSFNLKAKHEVTIESRLGTHPTYGQIVILDNVDTIKLIRRGKDFKKRPNLFLGGNWIHTIKDD